MDRAPAAIVVTLVLAVAVAGLVVAERNRPSPPRVASSLDDRAATMCGPSVEAGAVDADAADEHDGDDASAAAGTCEAFAKRTARALASVAQAIRVPDWKPPELCVVTRRATWGLVVDRAVAGAPLDEPLAEQAVGLAVILVHVDAHGTETSVLPLGPLQRKWTREGRLVDANLSLNLAWGSVALTVLRVFDFEGDGDPEILLEGTANDEGADRHVTEAWTFRDGAIAPFPPLANLEMRSVEDLDGDGLPDVVTAGPYARVEATDAIGVTFLVAPAFFALHALPGGAFSQVDRVAQDFARGKCGPRGPLDLDSRWFRDEAAQAVVCAKLWGATAADVTKAWDKVCAGFDAGHSSRCQDGPKRLGAIGPPFVLR
jgi:hypothetical protein